MSTTCTEAGLDEFLGPSLTEEQAKELYRRGEEAVVLGFLIMARKLAALSPKKPPPTAPSGMVPGYQKPATRTGSKKPGGKPGHKGHHRAPPARIDRRREHRSPCCPDCQGRVKRCAGFRKRFIEDIPEGITPVVTEHIIRRDWCPRCKKLVEPKVPDALPGATIGNRTAVMTAWIHYGLGNSISQIVDVFNYHLQMKLTRGGLVNLWQRFKTLFFLVRTNPSGSLEIRCVACRRDLVAGVRQDILAVGLRQSRPDLLHDRPLAGRTGAAAVFHGRIRGYVGQRFLGAYNAVVCAARQGCLVHLLATCIPWSTTRKAELIGRSFPKSCGDWWATRSAWDIKSPTCLRKTSTPVGNGLGNAGQLMPPLGRTRRPSGCQKAAATSCPPLHLPRQNGSSL